ncbi:DUF5999 family protein [Streptomyces lydicus]|uniref:DUF5999 family protein n=1 Tax=Streptomyces lydicus TaxID=47763 RepID=UPI0033E0824D
MCQHQPPCPSADATDHEAAHPVACHPEQGWCVNCTFMMLIFQAMPVRSWRSV